MFMGPYDEGGDWNDKGITGIDRFLKRSFKIVSTSDNISQTLSSEDEFVLHNTIKSVSEDIQNMKFNTSISRLMEFVNYFYNKNLTCESKHQFVQLLSPFAPHICEEMWSLLGSKDSVLKAVNSL